MSNDKFAGYKLFVESTQHLSERRQAATQTYLSVNTAIFAILALLVKEAGLKGWYLAGVCLPLFFVGVFACLIWHNIITQYKAIIGWRYNQLMAMEREMSGSYQVYVREWGEFFRPKQGQAEVWVFSPGGLAAATFLGFILNVRSWFGCHSRNPRLNWTPSGGPLDTRS